MQAVFSRSKKFIIIRCIVLFIPTIGAGIFFSFLIPEYRFLTILVMALIILLEFLVFLFIYVNLNVTYEVKENSLVVKKKTFMKEAVSLYFYRDWEDLHLIQRPLDKIFNMGTIKVNTVEKDESFFVGKINNPKIALEALRKKVKGVHK